MKPFFELESLTDEDEGSSAVANPSGANEGSHGRNEPATMEQHEPQAPPTGEAQADLSSVQPDEATNNELSSAAETVLPNQDAAPTVQDVTSLESHSTHDKTSPTPVNQRPQRNRRLPARFSNVYFITMMAFLSLCNAIDVTVANKGVIFVKGPAVAFSESTWTLVTELSTKSAHEVANNLT